ncbi:transmembrane protein, putative (macronuclear) [Tetrahymena thermophila SB210]|uniref:Transmembrane protein, putative n=1 Tax=Tetrahymena thermophila (strain SB210) TaxID=312017 RepID=Q22TU6_TETTS|nr:transmembrane protein, putative [Tetrahymena thermophila SB210]EAR88665.3 transmembrane protein, putative [Tetrahymena thermophila SB210]|eukprot:XP_001008910.3 transmembrane protein, putative [Tetrahymena thermophila SB210]
MQQNKEFYDESSCFLFVSILDQSFGIIKRANNSFVKALGFSNKQQIQGKSIFQLLSISNININQLQSCVINELISPIYNQIQNLPLFLAKHELGYCVPFQLKIQSQIVENQDFGLTIWAKEINEEHIYLVLNHLNPNQIKLANKLFCKQFLYSNFDAQQIRNIKTENLIPIIHYLIQYTEKNKEQQLQTVFIQPDKDLCQENLLLTDINFLNKLIHADICSATVSLSFQKDFKQLEPDIYLSIQNIQPVMSFKDKNNLILFYQQQIKEICNINLDFEHQEINKNDSTNNQLNHQFYQDNLILNQSLVQFENNLDTLYEEPSSTHSINSNQNSINKPAGDFQKNKRKNEKLKQKKYIKETNISPIQNQESILLMTPESKQTQQLNLLMENSIDLNQIIHSEQKIYKEDLVQNCISLVSPSRNYYSNQTSSPLNQFKKYSYYNDNYEINQFKKLNQIQNFNQNHFNNEFMKETNDIAPLSSKRGFIKPNQESSQIQIQKSFKKKNNHKEIKDKKFLAKQGNNLQQNIDIQSISSSSKSFLIRQVFENINKRKQMRYLKIINILGISSILVTLALTLSGFFTFFTSLASQRENFKYINWIYLINVQISYSLSEHNIFLLNEYGFYQTPPSQNQLFNDLLTQQQNSRIKLSKDYMNLLYNNTQSDIQVFKIIQNIQITQNIYQSNNTYQQKNVSMIYSILLQIFGIYYFVSNQDPDGIIKRQNEINYPALNEQVQSVFSQINEQYLSQLQNIQNESLIQLCVITFMTFIFLISIIPSYIFAKRKLEKILELFATFERQQLQEILDQIANQLQLYQVDSKFHFTNLDSYDLNNKKQNQHVISEKKLNISQTSSLEYSLKNLLIGLVVIFCLSIIYPIFYYLNVRLFIDSSTTINNFNNAVCISYFTVLNSLRARQGLAMAFLMPHQQPISVQTYQDILNQLTIQIDELPNQIQKNLESINSTNLHNQAIFNDFLLHLFTLNACNSIQKYNQYQNGDFSLEECNTVGKGSLQSGLLNGLMFFFSIYKDFLSFAYSSSREIFQQNFMSYNENFPAYKQFQFKIELSKEFEYLLNFFQDQNLQLYNNNESLSIILVVVQVCFVAIIFTVSWSYYFKSINKRIFSTKQLLNIFPQQYIIQNAYILSFLSKHD